MTNVNKIPTNEYLQYADKLLKYGMLPCTYEEWLKLDEYDEELEKKWNSIHHD